MFPVWTWEGWGTGTTSHPAGTQRGGAGAPGHSPEPAAVPPRKPSQRASHQLPPATSPPASGGGDLSLRLWGRHLPGDGEELGAADRKSLCRPMRRGPVSPVAGSAMGGVAASMALQCPLLPVLLGLAGALQGATPGKLFQRSLVPRPVPHCALLRALGVPSPARACGHPFPGAGSWGCGV